MLCLCILTARMGSEDAEPAANPPAAAAPRPAIEPKAVELLNAMGANLDAAKSMSFSVKTAFEEPARSGQPLFYMVEASVSLERPDKMKIVTSGDGPPSEFLYDGKTILEYLPTQNMVAETAAPATLGPMLDDVYEKYGIYFPFIHYIVDQSHEKLIEGLTSAFVIGQSKLMSAASRPTWLRSPTTMSRFRSGLGPTIICRDNCG